MGLLLAQMEPNGGGMHAVVDSLARTPLSAVLAYAFCLTLLRWVLHPLAMQPKSKLCGVARLGSEILDAVIYAGVLVFFIVRPFILQAYNIPSGSMDPTLKVDDYIVANKAIYRFQDPKVGDIVVFRPPNAATHSFERDEDGDANVDFIKRCVGAPGDLVEFKGDVLYRNGKEIRETFRHFSTEDPPGQDFVYREMRQDEYVTHLKQDFKLVHFKNACWPVLTIDDGVNDTDFTAPEYRVTGEETMRELRNLQAIRIPSGCYLMVGDNRLHSFDGRSWGLVPRESIIGRADFIWLPFSRMRILRRDGGE